MLTPQQPQGGGITLGAKPSSNPLMQAAARRQGMGMPGAGGAGVGGVAPGGAPGGGLPPELLAILMQILGGGQ